MAFGYNLRLLLLDQQLACRAKPACRELARRVGWKAWRYSASREVGRLTELTGRCGYNKSSLRTKTKTCIQNSLLKQL